MCQSWGGCIMNFFESLSTAFWTFSTIGDKLPLTVYSDNVCSISKSIILRTLRVLKETRLCCDRFNYNCRICPSVFNPDRSKPLDKDRTSSAGALNSTWGAPRNIIKFLDATNLMPFIIANSEFTNLRENLRDVEGGSIFDFQSMLKCQCQRYAGSLISSDKLPWAVNKNQKTKKSVKILLRTR